MVRIPEGFPQWAAEIVAAHCPVADTGAMWRVAQAWTDAADECRARQHELERAKADVVAASAGHTAHAIQQSYDQLIADTQAQAEYSDQRAEQSAQGATALELEIYTIIGVIGILVASLAVTMLMPPPGSIAATLAKRAKANAAMAVARRNTLAWLAQLAARYSRFAAAHPLATAIGWGTAFGVLAGGGVNLAAQQLQIVQGHREAIDRKSLGVATAAGAVGGAVGGGVGHGVARAVIRAGANSASHAIPVRRQVLAVLAAGATGGPTGGVAGGLTALVLTGGEMRGKDLIQMAWSGLGAGLVGSVGAGVRAVRIAGHAGTPIADRTIPDVGRPVDGTPPQVRIPESVSGDGRSPYVSPETVGEVNRVGRDLVGQLRPDDFPAGPQRDAAIDFANSQPRTPGKLREPSIDELVRMADAEHLRMLMGLDQGGGTTLPRNGPGQEPGSPYSPTPSTPSSPNSPSPSGGGRWRAWDMAEMRSMISTPEPPQPGSGGPLSANNRVESGGLLVHPNPTHQSTGSSGVTITPPESGWGRPLSPTNQVEPGAVQMRPDQASTGVITDAPITQPKATALPTERFVSNDGSADYMIVRDPDQVMRLLNPGHLDVDAPQEPMGLRRTIHAPAPPTAGSDKTPLVNLDFDVHPIRPEANPTQSSEQPGANESTASAGSLKQGTDVTSQVWPSSVTNNPPLPPTSPKPEVTPPAASSRPTTDANHAVKQPPSVADATSTTTRAETDPVPQTSPSTSGRDSAARASAPEATVGAAQTNPPIPVPHATPPATPQANTPQPHTTPQDAHGNPPHQQPVTPQAAPANTPQQHVNPQGAQANSPQQPHAATPPPGARAINFAAHPLQPAALAGAAALGGHQPSDPDTTAALSAPLPAMSGGQPTDNSETPSDPTETPRGRTRPFAATSGRSATDNDEPTADPEEFPTPPGTTWTDPRERNVQKDPREHNVWQDPREHNVQKIPPRDYITIPGVSYPLDNEGPDNAIPIIPHTPSLTPIDLPAESTRFTPTPRNPDDNTADAANPAPTRPPEVTPLPRDSATHPNHQDAVPEKPDTPILPAKHTLESNPEAEGAPQKPAGPQQNPHSLEYNPRESGVSAISGVPHLQPAAPPKKPVDRKRLVIQAQATMDDDSNKKKRRERKPREKQPPPPPPPPPPSSSPKNAAAPATPTPGPPPPERPKPKQSKAQAAAEPVVRTALRDWPHAAQVDTAAAIAAALVLQALTRPDFDPQRDRDPRVSASIHGEPGNRWALVEVTDGNGDMPTRSQDGKPGWPAIDSMIEKTEASGYELPQGARKTVWFKLFEAAGDGDPSQAMPEPDLDLIFVPGTVERGASQARREVRDLLRQAGMPDERVDDVLSVVSDAMQNVARHVPDSDAQVRVWRNGRIEIGDNSQNLPRPQEDSDTEAFADEEADEWDLGALLPGTHGRFFREMVGQLAKMWGVSLERAGGKTIWFDFGTTGPADVNGNYSATPSAPQSTPSEPTPAAASDPRADTTPATPDDQSDNVGDGRPPTDSEQATDPVLQRAKQGDPAAFQKLRNRHGREILEFVLEQLGVRPAKGDGPAQSVLFAQAINLAQAVNRAVFTNAERQQWVFVEGDDVTGALQRMARNMLERRLKATPPQTSNKLTTTLDPEPRTGVSETDTKTTPHTTDDTDKPPEPSSSKSEPSNHGLTDQEVEVVRMVASGMSNKAIADRLNRSESRVKFYIKAIGDKLGIHGRHGIVNAARASGIVGDEDIAESFQEIPSGILTEQEVKVLDLVADGMSNKDIGVAMGLSWLTVKAHLARIGGKLGTGDRAGMVARALHARILPARIGGELGTSDRAGMVAPGLHARILPVTDSGHALGHNVLTEEEIEMLALVAEGMTNKEIGVVVSADVVQSPDDVKEQLNRIGDKLGIRERAGMVGRAMRAGILPLADPVAEEPAPMPGRDVLSETEFEILSLVAEGLTNGQIGAARAISPATVRSLLLRIGFKLRAHDRTAMVEAALERGIVLNTGVPASADAGHGGGFGSNGPSIGGPVTVEDTNALVGEQGHTPHNRGGSATDAPPPGPITHVHDSDTDRAARDLPQQPERGGGGGQAPGPETQFYNDVDPAVDHGFFKRRKVEANWVLNNFGPVNPGPQKPNNAPTSGAPPETSDREWGRPSGTKEDLDRARADLAELLGIDREREVSEYIYDSDGNLKHHEIFAEGFSAVRWFGDDANEVSKILRNHLVKEAQREAERRRGGTSDRPTASDAIRSPLSADPSDGTQQSTPQRSLRSRKMSSAERTSKDPHPAPHPVGGPTEQTPDNSETASAADISERPTISAEPRRQPRDGGTLPLTIDIHGNPLDDWQDLRHQADRPAPWTKRRSAGGYAGPNDPATKQPGPSPYREATATNTLDVDQPGAVDRPVDSVGRKVSTHHPAAHQADHDKAPKVGEALGLPRHRREAEPQVANPGRGVPRGIPDQAFAFARDPDGQNWGDASPNVGRHDSADRMETPPDVTPPQTTASITPTGPVESRFRDAADKIDRSGWSLEAREAGKRLVRLLFDLTKVEQGKVLVQPTDDDFGPILTLDSSKGDRQLASLKADSIPGIPLNGFSLVAREFAYRQGALRSWINDMFGRGSAGDYQMVEGAVLEELAAQLGATGAGWLRITMSRGSDGDCELSADFGRHGVGATAKLELKVPEGGELADAELTLTMWVDPDQDLDTVITGVSGVIRELTAGCPTGRSDVAKHATERLLREEVAGRDNRAVPFGLQITRSDQRITFAICEVQGGRPTPRGVLFEAMAVTVTDDDTVDTVVAKICRWTHADMAWYWTNSNQLDAAEAEVAWHLRRAMAGIRLDRVRWFDLTVAEEPNTKVRTVTVRATAKRSGDSQGAVGLDLHWYTEAESVDVGGTFGATDQHAYAEWVVYASADEDPVVVPRRTDEPVLQALGDRPSVKIRVQKLVGALIDMELVKPGRPGFVRVAVTGDEVRVVVAHRGPATSVAGRRVQDLLGPGGATRVAVLPWSNGGTMIVAAFNLLPSANVQGDHGGSVGRPRDSTRLDPRGTVTRINTALGEHNPPESDPSAPTGAQDLRSVDAVRASIDALLSQHPSTGRGTAPRDSGEATGEPEVRARDAMPPVPAEIPAIADSNMQRAERELADPDARQGTDDREETAASDQSDRQNAPEPVAEHAETALAPPVLANDVNHPPANPAGDDAEPGRKPARVPNLLPMGGGAVPSLDTRFNDRPLDDWKSVKHQMRVDFRKLGVDPIDGGGATPGPGPGPTPGHPDRTAPERPEQHTDDTADRSLDTADRNPTLGTTAEAADPPGPQAGLGFGQKPSLGFHRPEDPLHREPDEGPTPGRPPQPARAADNALDVAQLRAAVDTEMLELVCDAVAAEHTAADPRKADAPTDSTRGRRLNGMHTGLNRLRTVIGQRDTEVTPEELRELWLLVHLLHAAMEWLAFGGANDATVTARVRQAYVGDQDVLAEDAVNRCRAADDRIRALTYALDTNPPSGTPDPGAAAPPGTVPEPEQVVRHDQGPRSTPGLDPAAKHPRPVRPQTDIPRERLAAYVQLGELRPGTPEHERLAAEKARLDALAHRQLKLDLDVISVEHQLTAPDLTPAAVAELTRRLDQLRPELEQANHALAPGHTGPAALRGTPPHARADTAVQPDEARLALQVVNDLYGRHVVTVPTGVRDGLIYIDNSKRDIAQAVGEDNLHRLTAWTEAFDLVDRMPNGATALVRILWRYRNDTVLVLTKDSGGPVISISPTVAQRLPVERSTDTKQMDPFIRKVWVALFDENGALIPPPKSNPGGGVPPSTGPNAPGPHPQQSPPPGVAPAPPADAVGPALPDGLNHDASNPPARWTPTPSSNHQLTTSPAQESAVNQPRRRTPWSRQSASTRPTQGTPPASSTTARAGADSGLEKRQPRGSADQSIEPAEGGPTPGDQPKIAERSEPGHRQETPQSGTAEASTQGSTKQPPAAGEQGPSSRKPLSGVPPTRDQIADALGTNKRRVRNLEVDLAITANPDGWNPERLNIFGKGDAAHPKKPKATPGPSAKRSADRTTDDKTHNQPTQQAAERDGAPSKSVFLRWIRRRGKARPQNKDLARLYKSTAISATGSALLVNGLPQMVGLMGASPQETGIVVAVGSGATFIVRLPAGYAAGRDDNLRTMEIALWAGLATTGATGAWLLAGLPGAMWAVAGSAIAVSAADKFSAASAETYGRLLAKTKDQRYAATTFMLLERQISGIVGGFFSSILARSPTLLFWADAVSYAVSRRMLHKLPPVTPQSTKPTRLFDGARAILSDRYLCGNVIMMFPWTLGATIAGVQQVDIMISAGYSDTTRGLISAAPMVGTGLGMLFPMSFVERINLKWIHPLTMAAWAALMLEFAQTSNPWLIGPTWVATGMIALLGGKKYIAYRNEVVPEAATGGATSTSAMINDLSGFLGGISAGLLLSGVGGSTTALLNSGLFVIVTGVSATLGLITRNSKPMLADLSVSRRAARRRIDKGLPRTVEVLTLNPYTLQHDSHNQRSLEEAVNAPLTEVDLTTNSKDPLQNIIDTVKSDDNNIHTAVIFVDNGTTTRSYLVTSVGDTAIFFDTNIDHRTNPKLTKKEKRKKHELKKIPRIQTDDIWKQSFTNIKRASRAYFIENDQGKLEYLHEDIPENSTPLRDCEITGHPDADNLNNPPVRQASGYTTSTASLQQPKAPRPGDFELRYTPWTQSAPETPPSGPKSATGSGSGDVDPSQGVSAAGRPGRVDPHVPRRDRRLGDRRRWNQPFSVAANSESPGPLGPAPAGVPPDPAEIFDLPKNRVRDAAGAPIVKPTTGDPWLGFANAPGVNDAARANQLGTPRKAPSPEQPAATRPPIKLAPAGLEEFRAALGADLAEGTAKPGVREVLADATTEQMRAALDRLPPDQVNILRHLQAEHPADRILQHLPHSWDEVIDLANQSADRVIESLIHDNPEHQRLTTLTAALTEATPWQLRDALDQLGTDQKKIIVGLFSQRKSPAEMAAIMPFGAPTIKLMAYGAARRMADHIARKRGLTIEPVAVATDPKPTESAFHRGYRFAEAERKTAAFNRIDGATERLTELLRRLDELHGDRYLWLERDGSRTQAWVDAHTMRTIEKFTLSPDRPPATAAAKSPQGGAGRWLDPAVIDLERADGRAVQQAMADGRITSVELVQGRLWRIQALDKEGPRLNAVRCLNPAAVEDAKLLDEERRRGHVRGPLHGLTVIVKDAYDVKDLPTTAGALALANSFPARDAFVIRQLRLAGAVILGKSNMTELNNYIATDMPDGDSALGGPVYNPYGSHLTPWGSSTGSAVAVAAGLADMGLCLETGGSTVGPGIASSNVAVDLSVGLASRIGILTLSDARDSPGAMARTVYDCAALVTAMAGIDPEDPATEASAGVVGTDYTAGLSIDGLRGKRIGVVHLIGVDDERMTDHLMGASIESVSTAFANAQAVLTEQGATLVQVAMDTTTVKWAPNTLPYEVKKCSNRYFAQLPDNAPVKSQDDLVRFNVAHAADGAIKYDQSLLIESNNVNLDDPVVREENEKNRATDTAIARDLIDSALAANQLDALLFIQLTACEVAPRAGYPQVAVPIGYDPDNNQPFGMILVGTAFSEATLFACAHAYELAAKVRRPPSEINPSFFTTPPHSDSDGGDRATRTQEKRSTRTRPNHVAPPPPTGSPAADLTSFGDRTESSPSNTGADADADFVPPASAELDGTGGTRPQDTTDSPVSASPEQPKAPGPGNGRPPFEISQEEAQRLCDQVRDREPDFEGLTSEIYLVHTSSGLAVIRLGKEPPKVNFLKKWMPENTAREYARAGGVRAPKTLYNGLDRSTGREFTIMQYIPGKMPTFNGSDLPDWFFDLLDQVQLTSTLPLPPGMDGIDIPEWQRQMIEHADKEYHNLPQHLLSKLREIGIEPLSNFIQPDRSRSGEKTGFNHNDACRPNLVLYRNKVWTLDWDLAGPSDPLWNVQFFFERAIVSLPDEADRARAAAIWIERISYENPAVDIKAVFTTYGRFEAWRKMMLEFEEMLESIATEPSRFGYWVDFYHEWLSIISAPRPGISREELSARFRRWANEH
ncbi:amidase family protein [Nocardia sp. NPDC049526]|uniref:amidase family protein n=1 Tax=Nocardia sp. NPDC049526 TaxID=3364316 RepID=UPI003789DEAF